MDDAEFAFEPDPRIRLAGQLEHERVHAELDLLDAFGREAMRVAQLDATVDRGMDHDAARERFVSVAEKLPRTAQTFGDRVVVALRGEHIGKATSSFDTIVGAREVLRRKERRGQSISRGDTDVKRLAHRAEHLAQTR